jgi:NADH-quinone oxidoreductase subunit L
MTRVMLMTFFGTRRWESDAHPHESPVSMTAPMVVLALGSVGAGALLSLGGTLRTWLEPVVGAATETGHAVPAWVTTTLALAVVAAGVLIAYRRYAVDVPRTAPQDVSPLTVAARRDLYGDAVNEAVFMRGGQLVTRAMVAVDDTAIDGSVTGLAHGVGRVSGALRGLQTGFARSYALSMLVGTALFAGAVLLAAMWR